jgi:hypothetical protein
LRDLTFEDETLNKEPEKSVCSEANESMYKDQNPMSHNPLRLSSEHNIILSLDQGTPESGGTRKVVVNDMTSPYLRSSENKNYEAVKRISLKRGILKRPTSAAPRTTIQN